MAVFTAFSRKKIYLNFSLIFYNYFCKENKGKNSYLQFKKLRFL